MPFYQTKGLIPPKRHTVFKRSHNSLYYEELISREGFSSIYSNVYHLKMPTRLSKMGNLHPFVIEKVQTKHQARHIQTLEIPNGGDIIYDRIPLFFNEDLIIHKSHVSKSMDSFYRNAHFDEMIYIQSGIGVINTNFGDLELREGDYVIIPRGVIWKLKIEESISCLVVESKGPIETPNRYRNRFGQLLEHSPFCERDIAVPDLDPIELSQNVHLKVRLKKGIQEYILKNSPFDIIGWDGCYYPWKLNINDFEPITGSIHQPPPVHQTFHSATAAYAPALIEQANTEYILDKNNVYHT